MVAASLAAAGLLTSSLGGCGSGDGDSCALDLTGADGILSAADVSAIVARAASHASARGAAVTIAVSDQQGNPLAIFIMPGSAGSSSSAYTQARTAAFFSTNGNAFTTRTAAFIIQDQYPPGVPNTSAGPLFGVQFSSLSCSDVQPRGASLIGAAGLSATPGSAPLYQGDFAAGGIGVSSGTANVDLDEEIAIAGATGFETPPGVRGDRIFLDGFRLPFFEAPEPGPVTVMPVAGSFSVGPIGTVSTGFPRRPIRGIVVEEAIPVRAGQFLSAAEVEQILGQGVERGETTRAAIRQCGPMKMNVSVVDVDGTPLGTVRTLDAPIFGFDVSVQKARTALAFSDPTHPLGRQLRTAIGEPADRPLAVTTRAVGFLAQIHYPPGVDGKSPGPLFLLQDDLSQSCAPFGNGITVFPGGIPLYRGEQLIGAIGISGDGIEQDDIVAASGSVGFEAPESIRTDSVEFGGTRLPYFREPRNPGRF